MVYETKPHKGTTHCFRFATINIVEGERRFTLLAIPMGMFSQKHEVLDELLTYAKKKININNVHVDRFLQCKMHSSFTTNLNVNPLV